MTTGPRIRHMIVPFDLWVAERALARLDVAERAELTARMSAPTPATARQAEVARLVLALADRLDPHARRSANATATHMAEAARAFAPPSCNPRGPGICPRRRTRAHYLGNHGGMVRLSRRRRGQVGLSVGPHPARYPGSALILTLAKLSRDFANGHGARSGKETRKALK